MEPRHRSACVVPGVSTESGNDRDGRRKGIKAVWDWKTNRAVVIRGEEEEEDTTTEGVQTDAVEERASPTPPIPAMETAAVHPGGTECNSGNTSDEEVGEPLATAPCAKRARLESLPGDQIQVDDTTLGEGERGGDDRVYLFAELVSSFATGYQSARLNAAQARVRLYACNSTREALAPAEAGNEGPRKMDRKPSASDEADASMGARTSAIDIRSMPEAMAKDADNQAPEAQIEQVASKEDRMDTEDSNAKATTTVQEERIGALEEEDSRLALELARTALSPSLSRGKQGSAQPTLFARRTTTKRPHFVVECAECHSISGICAPGPSENNGDVLGAPRYPSANAPLYSTCPFCKRALCVLLDSCAAQLASGMHRSNGLEGGG